jgi:hypothetical protein
VEEALAVQLLVALQKAILLEPAVERAVGGRVVMLLAGLAIGGVQAPPARRVV